MNMCYLGTKPRPPEASSALCACWGGVNEGNVNEGMGPKLEGTLLIDRSARGKTKQK